MDIMMMLTTLWLINLSTRIKVKLFSFDCMKMCSSATDLATSNQLHFNNDQ